MSSQPALSADRGMDISIHAFVDRRSAGVALGRAVQKMALQPPIVVLGLPRGGVAVAYEVARALGAPLDVMAVRKIAMPGQPELAIGAIASGGVIVRESVAAPHMQRSAFPSSRRRKRSTRSLSDASVLIAQVPHRSSLPAAPWC